MLNFLITYLCLTEAMVLSNSISCSLFIASYNFHQNWQLGLTVHWRNCLTTMSKSWDMTPPLSDIVFSQYSVIYHFHFRFHSWCCVTGIVFDFIASTPPCLIIAYPLIGINPRCTSLINHNCTLFYLFWSSKLEFLISLTMIDIKSAHFSLFYHYISHYHCELILFHSVFSCVPLAAWLIFF